MVLDWIIRENNWVVVTIIQAMGTLRTRRRAISIAFVLVVGLRDLWGRRESKTTLGKTGQMMGSSRNSKEQQQITKRLCIIYQNEIGKEQRNVHTPSWGKKT